MSDIHARAVAAIHGIDPDDDTVPAQRWAAEPDHPSRPDPAAVEDDPNDGFADAGPPTRPEARPVPWARSDRR